MFFICSLATRVPARCALSRPVSQSSSNASTCIPAISASASGSAAGGGAATPCTWPTSSPAAAPAWLLRSASASNSRARGDRVVRRILPLGADLVHLLALKALDIQRWAALHPKRSNAGSPRTLARRRGLALAAAGAASSPSAPAGTRAAVGDERVPPASAPLAGIAWHSWIDIGEPLTNVLPQRGVFALFERHRDRRVELRVHKVEAIREARHLALAILLNHPPDRAQLLRA